MAFLCWTTALPSDFDFAIGNKPPCQGRGSFDKNTSLPNLNSKRYAFQCFVSKGAACAPYVGCDFRISNLSYHFFLEKRNIGGTKLRKSFINTSPSQFSCTVSPLCRTTTMLVRPWVKLFVPMLYSWIYLCFPLYSFFFCAAPLLLWRMKCGFNLKNFSHQLTLNNTAMLECTHIVFSPAATDPAVCPFPNDTIIFWVNGWNCRNPSPNKWKKVKSWLPRMDAGCFWTSWQGRNVQQLKHSVWDSDHEEELVCVCTTIILVGQKGVLSIPLKYMGFLQSIQQTWTKVGATKNGTQL